MTSDAGSYVKQDFCCIGKFWDPKYNVWRTKESFLKDGNNVKVDFFHLILQKTNVGAIDFM